LALGSTSTKTESPFLKKNGPTQHFVVSTHHLQRRPSQVLRRSTLSFMGYFSS
jgi:hypothetical protein